MEDKFNGKDEKDNVPVSVRLEKGNFEKLGKFHEDFGQSMTVTVERAMEMYNDDYYEKMEIICR